MPYEHWASGFRVNRRNKTKKQKNGKIKSKIESNSGRLEKINWDEENKLVP